MSKKSEVYRNLRKAVTQLGELQGDINTGDIVSGLDKLWRGLLKTRKIMLDTLKEQGTIGSANDLPLFDFASLYHLIYRAKSNVTFLCPECGAKLDQKITDCPFCEAKIGDSTSNFKAIDFNVLEAAPDWNISLDPKEMFLEPDPFDEEIKPITSRDDIIGPTGSTDQNRNRKLQKMSTSTKKLVVWMRKREFGKLIPFSADQLGALKFYDLRTIATLIPSYDPTVVSTYNSNELVSFIIGAQGIKPLDPGPPPYGQIDDIGGQK